ncbi:CoA transferase, partial [Salmonella enterica]|uniref:CoA transferase n=1 Tax=Salmonella enterica TaxID=28901 RepID=UPI0035259D76
LYTSADGWIYICCMNDKFWTILLDILQRPELADDPRFATMKGRSDNRAELTVILDEVFAQSSSHDWMAKLQGRIPAAPVETLEDALNNPFLEESAMIAHVEHSSGRTLRMLANP